MKLFINIILLFLPWPVRRYLLSFFFHYAIHPSARIGFSLIMPNKLEMGRNCRIGHLTFCKSTVDRLSMVEDCFIGSSILITGFSSTDKTHFSHVLDRKCEMVLDRGVGIPSRKFFDCNGGIYIGEFTTIAGQWTQFLTHSLDVYNSRQDAKPIRIGKYCFVGTGCILLPGAELPDYCILGAGSVLNKRQNQSDCLYAGVPAVPKRNLNHVEIPWMRRTSQAID